MKKVDNLQLQFARDKFLKAMILLKASVKKTAGFESEKIYTTDELEPYDALSDRFMRCVEVAIKFFRTYEYYLQAEQSQSFRDGLHRMEKLGLISTVDVWIDMRNIRNKIVHDYIAEDIGLIYELIRGEFYNEFAYLEQQVLAINYD